MSNKKVVLKKLKELGKIWHDDSRLVFKSETEKLVIGRYEDNKFIPLDNEAVIRCKTWNFKYDPSIEVEGLEEQTAYGVESLLIDIMGFRYNKTGILTNISKGGLGGDTFTNNPNKEEIREKHRLNATGINNNMYGLSLEERPSHKAKISGNHWNLGRKAKEETLKKMSINNSRENNPKAKTVIKMDLSGNELEVYSTTVEAAEKNNIKHKSGISRACKEGTTAGGFKWKFKNG